MSSFLRQASGREEGAPTRERAQAAAALHLWLEDQVELGVGGFELRAPAACPALAVALGQAGLGALARNVMLLPVRLAQSRNGDTALASLCGLALQLQQMSANQADARGDADPCFGLSALAPSAPLLKPKETDALERAILVGFARTPPPPELDQQPDAAAWLRVLAPSVLRRMRRRR